MKIARINAVSPQFFLEARDVSDLTTEFGPHCGRYLLNYPTDWEARFVEHARKLTPIEAKKAIARLSKITPSLISKTKAYHFDEDQSWQSNILSLPLHQSLGFKVGDALDPRPFADWSTALDAIKDAHVTSNYIRPTVSAHILEIEPLISYSPSFTVIDPYFDPISRFLQQNFLFSLLDLINHSRCFQINIIVRKKEIIPEDNADPKLKTEKVQRTLDGIIPERLGTGRKLSLYLVDDSPHPGDTLKLHARFYLSKFGGINLDQGVLLKNQKNSKADSLITYLDSKAHEKIMREVCGPIFDFHLNGASGLYQSYPKSVELLTFCGR